MTTQNMPFQEAITRVLSVATSPLRADEIAAAIVERGLKPEAKVHSVYAILSGMVKQGLVIKPDRALYAINPNPSQPVSDERIREADEDEMLNRMCGYGLYWDRGKVNWNPGQGASASGRLLGREDNESDTIDFSNQAGVYVLYSGLTPVYVGQTTARNNALITRLKAHNSNDRRGSRWDKFSWFGFRPVGADGNLETDDDATVSIELLITFMEAVMIEAFIPPMNDRGGDLLGTLYEQVEDEELLNLREDEFRQRVGRAISGG